MCTETHYNRDDWIGNAFSAWFFPLYFNVCWLIFDRIHYKKVLWLYSHMKMPIIIIPWYFQFSAATLAVQCNQHFCSGNRIRNKNNNNTNIINRKIQTNKSVWFNNVIFFVLEILNDFTFFVAGAEKPSAIEMKGHTMQSV